MRFRGEGQSEEVVDELVFCQDFLSVFEAARSFHLVFFFAFNKIRGWFYKIEAVGLSLMIG